MTKDKMEGDKLCPFYNVGFCKFKDNCVKIHPKDDCLNTNCKRKRCMKRHRKLCKYEQHCRRFKKSNSCEFKHVTETSKHANAEFVLKTKEAKENILQIEHLKSEIKLLKEDINIKVLKLASLENKTCDKCNDNSKLKEDFLKLKTKFDKVVAENKI